MQKIHAATTVLAAILAFAATEGLSVAPANAAEPATTTTIEPSAIDPARVTVHCAVEIRPTAEAASAETPVCFTTERGVERYLAAIAASRGALESPSRTSAGTVAVGTIHSDSHGGGSSLTFWGSSGCAGVSYGFASLPSNWSSIISSGGGKNGCWATMYTATNYGGSRLNCTPWCGTLGSWNDGVGSIVFRPTGTWG